MNNFLVSPLIPEQVPDFVREDYNTFLVFLQKYYEWLETNNQVIKSTEDLKNSIDVDLASNYYVDLIKKEFLPDFPETLALDKRKFIKLVNNFYSAKGTPDSIKFLFRALFNEEVEIYFPYDDVFKSSDGKWVQPIVLRVETTDTNIFNIEKTLIVGSTSKASAVVEKVSEKIEKNSGVVFYEIYISKIEKQFQTGETVSSTYYDNTIPITVTARVIGFISRIIVDPNNRGLFYKGVEPSTGYTGDPVSIVGGLNPVSNTPLAASARVTEVSKGSVTNLFVDDYGYGFRSALTNANTSIVDFENGFTDAIFDTEAAGYVSLVDTSNPRLINLINLTIETANSLYPTINLFANTIYANLSSDVADPNSNSINVISTVSFTVYPLTFITITNNGKGYQQKPEIDVYSYYLEEKATNEVDLTTTTIVPGSSFITNTSQNLVSIYEPGDQVKLSIKNKLEEVREVISVSNNTLSFDKNFNFYSLPVSGVSVSKIIRRDLKKIGSLGRIKVVTPGTGYANGETIIFTGGTGYGANAYISVNATGSISSVTINNHSSNAFIIGGEGYSTNNLPSLNVNTTSGVGAVLEVMEICGDGESVRTETNKIGAVLKITLDSFGYDYISLPIVSLKNADLITTDITPGEVFSSNVVVYQGPDLSNGSFQAFVTSYNPDTGFLRIHDYSGSLNLSLPLKTFDDVVSANLVSSKFYGDGKARATAEFLQGTSRLSGLYLNLDGQPSGDKRLQDGIKYHNYSYVINTETPYSDFKKTLTSLVHPVGTKSFITTKNKNEKSTALTKKDLLVYSESQLQNTFNVSYCSNVIISTTPATSNLMSEVSIGDYLVIEKLVKGLNGTVNVSSSSKTVFGSNTNFINDLYANAVINLSSGNTEVVSYVTNANTFVTLSQINVTDNNLSINVVFDDLAKVTFVNSNTIFVDSNLCGNLVFGNVFVRKITGYAGICYYTDSSLLTADITTVTTDASGCVISGDLETEENPTVDSLEISVDSLTITVDQE